MRRWLGPLLLAACASSPPFAVPGLPWEPELYLCVRVPEPPEIDGKLDDAAWKDAAWTADFVDIEGALKLGPRHRTRAKMVWDATHLYVGAELDDPHVLATLEKRDAVLYHDNDFEFFVDPDGDTHRYFELEINAFGTEWDLLLEKPYRDGGPARTEWTMRGLKTAVHVDGTINDAGFARGAARRPAPLWHRHRGGGVHFRSLIARSSFRRNSRAKGSSRSHRRAQRRRCSARRSRAGAS